MRDKVTLQSEVLFIMFDIINVIIVIIIISTVIIIISYNAILMSSKRESLS